MAGLQAPLSTLRPAPRGALRMTRGQSGLLFLLCLRLSLFTLCRSPGALACFIFRFSFQQRKSLGLNKTRLTVGTPEKALVKRQTCAEVTWGNRIERNDVDVCEIEQASVIPDLLSAKRATVGPLAEHIGPNGFDIDVFYRSEW
jgi:hypothetical protein